MILFPLIERVGRRMLHERGFVSRFVDTPLGSVHAYDAAGKGALPPVAVLHGLGATATGWGPMMMRLLPHVTGVVAPEFPGHGFSGAPTGTVTRAGLFDAMTVALDTLLREPTVLVGNSLGGALAVHYAIVRPERVRGLVLLGPAGAQSTDAELKSVTSAFDFETRAEALRFMDRVFHPIPLIYRLAAHEMPAWVAHRVAVREIAASLTPDSMSPPESVAALRMPILLVWGKRERLLPESTLAWYRAHLPAHAVIEEPEGVAHVPPPSIADRIVEFLRTRATDAPAESPRAKARLDARASTST
jgi:pimeloyl-ACP methyl ester carboxylesterase